MSDRLENTISGTRWWTRASVIIVRLALLLFLIWALVSAKLDTSLPVATDNPAADPDNRTTLEECQAPMELAG